jgi:hypothetical protein
MTKKQRAARRSAIIGELVKLSHAGWDRCQREDWQSLEAELQALEAKA